MKVLIVYAHMDPKSFNRGMKDLAVKCLEDLHEMGFNSVAGVDDFSVELILQFPMWWYGIPAILKGWVDRVLANVEDDYELNCSSLN